MQENEIQLIFMGGILDQFNIKPNKLRLKDLVIIDISCILEFLSSIFDSYFDKSSFYNQ